MKEKFLQAFSKQSVEPTRSIEGILS